MILSKFQEPFHFRCLCFLGGSARWFCTYNQWWAHIEATRCSERHSMEKVPVYPQFERCSIPLKRMDMLNTKKKATLGPYVMQSQSKAVNALGIFFIVHRVE